ncbi:MAG: glycoside hydrolase family 3 C-terminal domain-containing protein [Muribaculaceae bacterium]|nr:glycoside hydrolase family 3 C-terminal domain-containing protein [Muribaculaceae bacterium]
MKKTTLTLLSAACGIFSASAVSPAIPQDPAIEKRIKEIMSKMTLEEKIGQMCELEIGYLQDADKSNGYKFNDEKVEEAFRKYKVGSILNTPNGEAQTVEVWHDVIERIQKESMKYIGIPDIYGVDQIHGTTYTAGGTLFPQEINMAASFNRALVRRAGEISAYETRAGSIPWTYAPVMDIGRDARWSRSWESFGEDPYINAQMAKELVLGYQGPDPNHIGKYNVASCAKHFIGYGSPKSGKDRTPAIIAPNELREKYFLPFKEAIQTGALSVMVNSGSINGMPVHADYELMTGWLKDELNWDGVIVTDWADIHNLWQREKVAKDYKEAIELSINAGVDMSMVPYDAVFCDLLLELVKEGRVKEERVNDACARILRMKLRCDLWNLPYTKIKDYPLFGSKEFADVALDLAVQSEVLLKNDKALLPLQVGTKLLVTGPNANTMRALNGGWSYKWQGTNDEKFVAGYNTIYKALSNRFSADNVIYVPGVTYDDNGNWDAENVVDIEAAVKAAANVDVIVACIGENSYCETPGNLTDLNLSANQKELVKALAQTGKPILLILNEGRTRLIGDITPLATAVVDVMLPGNYGADALALLLAGDRNFSAKLPFTYPKEISSHYVYDAKPAESVPTMDGSYNYSASTDLEWEFGYGLSYTSFSFSNLNVSLDNFNADDVLTVTVDVTNTGKVEGATPVLLYSSDLIASLTPDVKRLRAFDKVNLQPGETSTVTLKLPAKDLAFVGRDGKWRLEAGEFMLRIADQNKLINCTTTKVWDTPNI